MPLPELVGARQVRAAAEVDELALAVDADGRDLVAGRLGRGDEVLDELDLEGLVEPQRQAGGARTGLAGPEHRERLVHRQLVALHRQVLADDLRHLLLDAREVGLGDRLGKLEVVVEAALDGRPDGVLGAREQTGDGLRHDVRRGVALDVDGVGVVALEGDDVELVAVVQRRGGVDEQGDVRLGGGGDAARDGGFRQSRPDGRRRVAHGRAVVEFEGGAVGKGDVQGHERPVLSSCAPAHLAGAVDSWSLADRSVQLTHATRTASSLRERMSTLPALTRRTAALIPAVFGGVMGAAGALLQYRALARARHERGLAHRRRRCAGAGGLGAGARTSSRALCRSPASR